MTRWRPMEAGDRDAVVALADAIHVDHPEEPAVLAERWHLYPAGCFVLAEGAALDGYALSHPWRLDEPPALNSLLGRLPDPATTFYVHDVAIAPSRRGQGHARAILDRLVEHATCAGFDALSLVAVNGTWTMWERLGFRTVDMPGLEGKLSSYGADARPMVRRLTR